jgi:hypothetical protein
MKTECKTKFYRKIFFLPVLAIGGMILRSNGGIQRPHKAVALGKEGA